MNRQYIRFERQSSINEGVIETSVKRRSYIRFLTAGTVGLAGCISPNDDTGPGQNDSNNSSVESIPNERIETRVEDESAFFTYDTDEYREIFDYEEDRSRDERTDSPARNGSALEVPIPEGEHRGMRMRFWFDDQFGSEFDEASATYWLYVPDEFEFAKSHSGGGKLPGFQGTYNECGAGDLGPCDGTSGWSARMSFVRPKAVYLDTDFGLAFYVYHGEMAGEPLYPYGTYALWNIGLEFGKWHRIDQYVRMNTPGEHDGVLRGWVDGELAFERDGYFFRDSNNEYIQIEEFVNTVYYGGEWTSPSDNSFYFDNLEIRTGPPDSDELEEDE